MKLTLTDYDQALLGAEFGPAAQMAMKIMVRMTPIFRAESLLDISAAHIDSTVFMGDATMEYAEHLAGLGAKVKVPSTLNVSGVDEHGWRDWAVPPEWAAKAHRQMMAYQGMGCIATWTCAPYQTEHRPQFGQQVAWGESNAIAFANSVIGARTERYPDLLDICAAITGRVPAAGLHLAENRGGDLMIRLKGIPEKLQAEDVFYPVLGHYIGKIAANKIPVIEGLAVRPTDDQFKALSAAVASSGAIALFHIVGHTPEAPTLTEAFPNGSIPAATELELARLREARDDLSSSTGSGLDMVVLGSPHFSFDEFKKLSALLKERRKHPAVKFLVTTSRAVRMLAEKAGFIETITRFGGQTMVDCCILTTPMLPPQIKRLMTNSAKFAYYSPGLLNVEMAYGRLADCVESAIKGKIIRDESIWEK